MSRRREQRSKCSAARMWPRRARLSGMGGVPVCLVPDFDDAVGKFDSLSDQLSANPLGAGPIIGRCSSVN